MAVNPPFTTKNPPPEGMYFDFRPGDLVEVISDALFPENTGKVGEVVEVARPELGGPGWLYCVALDGRNDDSLSSWPYDAGELKLVKREAPVAPTAD